MLHEGGRYRRKGRPSRDRRQRRRNLGNGQHADGQRRKKDRKDHDRRRTLLLRNILRRVRKNDNASGRSDSRQGARLLQKRRPRINDAGKSRSVAEEDYGGSGRRKGRQ